MDRTESQAQAFRNRLLKNARHLRKWARRSGVSCYRLYDQDIPEVPLVVDWYEGRLHVATLERPDEHPAAWLDRMVESAREALEVPPDAAFVKRRERQRTAEGPRQYEKLGHEGRRFVVSEGGLRFLVNLSDYLDTGLFLDHRQTRALVRAEAAGKRFLNLFAYTGSFTVYAAAAGAATTTVDLSNTYLDWARDNLRLNELAGPHKSLTQHDFVRDDVFGFLDGARRRGSLYDLVVLDPPTFSNSKKMDRTLDLRRDHPALLADVLSVMPPGGVLWFSTNARKFRLDPGGLPAEIEDVTARTVPPDFERRRPHRCWRLVKSA